MPQKYLLREGLLVIEGKRNCNGQFRKISISQYNELDSRKRGKDALKMANIFRDCVAVLLIAESVTERRLEVFVTETQRRMRWGRFCVLF